MYTVLAHASVAWLESAVLAIAALIVGIAIIRDLGRRRTTPTKESP